MNRHYDVVIIGAGMVGLVSASLLRVTVIDAGREPTFNPADEIALRVSAIAPGSADILARAGAWSGIRDTRACPYREMRVWDAAGHADGPETLHFDAAEFALPELGHIVENRLVQHALLQSLNGSEVSFRFAATIESLSRRGHRFEIVMASGERFVPDLLIGADGACSLVRGSAGIGIRSWPYAQKAFVTMLEPEFEHRYMARQRFLQEGPIGILPLGDGRISIVWSTTPATAEAALLMSDADLSARLTEATDGVLGTLTPAGPRGAFPLRAQHAATYVQDGVALVGDAAHTVHPLAGQGVNLGFADAAELAGAVARALAAGEDPGDLPTLRNYERARKGANGTMLFFVHGLNRLFSNRSMSLARVRGAGMYLFNKSGPLRSRAVATALGIH